MAVPVLLTVAPASSSGLSLADLSGIASLVVAAVALVIAFYSIQRGNRNSSASLMVALNEGFRQAWVRYRSPGPEGGDFELAELLNLLEIAAGAHCEGSLAGVARELAEEYLCLNLALLEMDEHARPQIEELQHSASTFKYLRLFLAKVRKSGAFGRFKADLQALKDRSETA
jgi:hypothetical protein